MDLHTLIIIIHIYEIFAGHYWLKRLVKVLKKLLKYSPIVMY